MCIQCSICLSAQKIDSSVKKHVCHVNHYGKFKGMEAKCLVILALRAPESCYMITIIISDDESGTRKCIRYGPQRGNLPLTFCIPKFLADPSHRIKAFGGYVYKFCRLTFYQRPVCKEHAERFKKLVDTLSTNTGIQSCTKWGVHHKHQYCTYSTSTHIVVSGATI